MRRKACIEVEIPKFGIKATILVCYIFSYSCFKILTICSKCIRKTYLIVLIDLKKLIVNCLQMTIA